MTALTPALPGVTVRVLQFGDDLELVNRSGTEVVVPGYEDEPYLRIGPDGVWRNQRSPATYINLDRYAPGRRCPPTADPAGRAGVGAAVHGAALRRGTTTARTG